MRVGLLIASGIGGEVLLEDAVDILEWLVMPPQILPNGIVLPRPQVPPEEWFCDQDERPSDGGWESFNAFTRQVLGR